MSKQIAVVDMGASKVAVVIASASNLRSVIGSGCVSLACTADFEARRRALQEACKEAEQQAHTRITELVLMVSEPQLACTNEEEPCLGWTTIDVLCRDRNNRPALFYSLPSERWRRWLRLCARRKVVQFLLPATGIGQVLLQSTRASCFLVIDMGASATGIVAFDERAPKALGMLPRGGDSITAEIASYLTIPYEQAEGIKRKLLLQELAQDGTARFPHRILPQDRNAPSAEVPELPLAEIATRLVLPLYAEWMDAIAKLVLQFALPPSAPVFLTGGSARMPGVLALASGAWRRCVLPVRLPRIGGLETRGQEICFGACAGMLTLNAA